jgi:hypothetical protein
MLLSFLHRHIGRMPSWSEEALVDTLLRGRLHIGVHLQGLNDGVPHLTAENTIVTLFRFVF